MKKSKKLTLTTFIHKFMDVEGSEMPGDLVKKLREQELFTYRDMVLKEHLYSTDTINEMREDNPEAYASFTYEEMKMLEHISSMCNNEEIGYFRFVFN